jgi:hypothetical protein
MATNIQVVGEQFKPHGARVITQESVQNERIERRLQREESVIKSGAPRALDKDQQKGWYDERERRIRELQDGKIPRLSFPPGFRFDQVGRVVEGHKDGHVFEITNTQSQFGDAFSKRLEYEVDAGRDEEPTIYQPIYDQITDANFDEVFDIQTLKNVGVVMTQITEGGEVRFASVGKGNHTIRILQYAAGLSYTDKLFLYNKTWQLGPIEREVGKATNALHNHAHLSPILTATYGSDNQTAASTVGSTLYEKIANTLDAGITASVTDETNPRRGPYVLLCSLSNLTSIERALGRVPQEGFNLRPSTMDRIRTIIAYDGWSNTMGEETTTYAGVTANKCYLVHTGHRMFDFQSKVKIPFRRQAQSGDIKRFISQEIVYDSHFGVYAAPTRAVEEITLPTS